MIEVAGVPVPDGQRVLARPGDLVRVTLDETGTTGFQWSVATADSLDVERDTFVPPDGSAPPGAGGRRVFEVRGAQQGDARLVLHLRRPWESRPIEERVIDIRVGPGTDTPADGAATGGPARGS